MKIKNKIRSYKNLRIYLAVRELINYAYIIKTAKKQKTSSTWQSFGLNVDWVGRIYTVLNLRKEDAGDDEMVKRTRLLEMMMPINKYLKTLDLHEIMFPAIEKKSDRSYLIVYSPLFERFTVLYFLRVLFILAALTTCMIYLPTIITGVSWLLNLL